MKHTMLISAAIAVVIAIYVDTANESSGAAITLFILAFALILIGYGKEISDIWDEVKASPSGGVHLKKNPKVIPEITFPSMVKAGNEAPTKISSENEILDTVITRKMQIVDDDDNVRIVLSTIDSTAIVEIFDSSGNERIGMHVEDDKSGNCAIIVQNLEGMETQVGASENYTGLRSTYGSLIGGTWIHKEGWGLTKLGEISTESNASRSFAYMQYEKESGPILHLQDEDDWHVITAKGPAKNVKFVQE